MQDWQTIKAKDIINGSMGKCYATIDGNVETMLYVKNIEARVEKIKSEIPVLGQTGKKHKATGWSGTGSMTVYYCTSLFRKMMIKYIKEGIDNYLDLMIENEDPTSSVGKQTVLLKRVNIDNVDIAKLDIDSTELDEDMDFTFEDVDMLDEFSPLVGE